MERESTSGARLLIIPSRSAQKIPFAAFPMRDQSLIDLYSLMIVPAAEDNYRRATGACQRQGEINVYGGR
ncbi:hypothetical protein [Mesorhizobium sp. M0130]|uniref:hypothetical protein n=1 Tax=Mesorhizobium sp. M0130 TaxID=2956887 RepID=UPI003335CA3B